MQTHAKPFGKRKAPEKPADYKDCKHDIVDGCYYCFRFPTSEHPERKTLFCTNCLTFMEDNWGRYCKRDSYHLDKAPETPYITNRVGERQQKYNSRTGININHWSVCKLTPQDETNYLRDEFESCGSQNSPEYVQGSVRFWEQLEIQELCVRRTVTRETLEVKNMAWYIGIIYQARNDGRLSAQRLVYQEYSIEQIATMTGRSLQFLKKLLRDLPTWVPDPIGQDPRVDQDRIDRLNQVDRENKELREQIQELTSNQKLTSNHKRLALYEKVNQDLTDQNRQLKEENTSLRHEKRFVSSRNDQLVPINQALASVNHQLALSNKNLLQEIKDLQRSINQMYLAQREQ